MMLTEFVLPPARGHARGAWREGVVGIQTDDVDIVRQHRGSLQFQQGDVLENRVICLKSNSNKLRSEETPTPLHWRWGVRLICLQRCTIEFSDAFTNTCPIQSL
jgi:hypothetical protein